MVAITDYMRGVPDQVARFVDRPYLSLGTDGFGRSDARDALRSYFEVDSANAARKFLLEHDVEKADADKVWLSIALHTTPGIPEFLEPEVALVTAGVETDVLGIDRDELSPEALAAVTAAHPRPDFKQRILAAFNDGMKHRPNSTFGTVNDDVLAHFDPTFVRDNFVEIILDNTWPE